MLVSLNGDAFFRKIYPNWFKKNTLSFCLLQEYERDFGYRIRIEQDRVGGLPVFLDQAVSEGENLAPLSKLVGRIRKGKPKYTFLPDTYQSTKNLELVLTSWKKVQKIDGIYTHFLAIPHGKNQEEVEHQIMVFVAHGIQGIGIGYDCISPGESREEIRGKILEKYRKIDPSFYIHFLGVRNYGEVFEYGKPNSIDTSSPFSQGVQGNIVGLDGIWKKYKRKSFYNQVNLSLTLTLAEKSCIEHNLEVFWMYINKY